MVKKNKSNNLNGFKGNILVYESENGNLRLDVRLERETVWMSQSNMAQLFQCSVDNISLHLKNLYKEGELDSLATTEEYSVVQKEGNRNVRRMVVFYNLDVIISVGYRVKSSIATRFRIWATQRLKEYLIKGFTMDDARLKEAGNSRYFEELLERIRDIRSSEKVFWRKILDIYATSIDYDLNSNESQVFFKHVQNKMHWAAHGHTAAELIYSRVNSKKKNMGITNYSGKKLLKRDVEIAKNYLGEDELNVLNRIVTAYLEVAELQALNHIPMTMTDWIKRLDDFLTMTGRDILNNAGSINHESALKKAHDEYEKFRTKQLEEPTEVENHFIEAEKQLKKIESTKKKQTKKTPK
ncbi:MAG: virulence RhuM family protein [Candidatus Aureabacteria bacterium]|nr:virulence RhuM family protein [Candidatus Auribacterota bacterium]